MQLTCKPDLIADAALTFEKICVIVGGGGIGYLVFGLIWLGKPSPRAYSYSLNRRFFSEAPRDVRRGAILAVVGWGLAGVTWLIQNR
jgi:hypothetical protein